MGSQPVSKIYLGSAQVWPSGSPPCEHPASLLLHFDGADGSTAFTDGSTFARAVLAGGAAALSTSSPRFGSAALTTNGGGWVNCPVPNVGPNGNEDFTVELWAKFNSQPQYQPFISAYERTGGAFQILLGDGQIHVGLLDDHWVVEAPVSLSADGTTWTHCAVCQSDGNMRVYVDGVLVGQAANSAAFNGSSGMSFAGADWSSGLYQCIDGSIDEVRVVKGLAVYTDSFTPPTAPLAACAVAMPSGGTPAALLLHLDSDFADSSPAALTPAPVSVSGTLAGSDVAPVIDASLAEFGSGSALMAGGSLISTGAGELFHFTNGADFTVEAWIYPTDPTMWPGIFGTDNWGGFFVVLSGDGGRILIKPTGQDGWLSPAATIAGYNQWNHLAITRQNTTLRVFVGGVLQASVENGGEYPADTNCYIGGAAYSNLSFVGNMDEVRVVHGLAVYVGDFVPSTQPLTPSATRAPFAPAGTMLFSGCDNGNLVGTYADGSGGRYTETISEGSC